ncbi:MAG TPA: 23S rRNA (guanosine(2251)-2'-O)-methyltransferase RlmB [Candidatus Omnitrophota bacterium]|nr:23S rRNA (guanosine(2251)-2'-O)-methyltransferase RlmB [Candidatus Omnitrophota bacterium]
MKLSGRNSIMERLRSNPRSIRKIYVEHGFKGTLSVHAKARQHGISVFSISSSQMMKIGRDKNTQGILADVDEVEYLPYEDVLEAALKKKRSLIFLDGLNDPQNLGAIIRSLACLGKFSVVLPTHDSVSVTESVLRVASGGENYVPFAKVPNLANAIQKAKESGFHIAGAVVKGGQCLTEIALPHPLGLVIGSEQKGIRDIIKKHLDLELSIPMACDTLSFNVAQATTILCYEITKQKRNYRKENPHEPSECH